MMDIVERLNRPNCIDGYKCANTPKMEDAAEIIASLRAEVERLRAENTQLIQAGEYITQALCQSLAGKPISDANESILRWTRLAARQALTDGETK